MLRSHDETETQAWREHLGEASDVDRAPLPVEAHERRERGAFVAILAVEVVLDDISANRNGPLEQLEAAAQRQRHTERKLARWCQDCSPCHSLLPRGIKIEAVPIDEHATGPQARPGQCIAQRWIAGLLHI